MACICPSGGSRTSDAVSLLFHGQRTDIKNMEKLIDALEDNDDVQYVWHNWEQE